MFKSLTWADLDCELLHLPNCHMASIYIYIHKCFVEKRSREVVRLSIVRMSKHETNLEADNKESFCCLGHQCTQQIWKDTPRFSQHLQKSTSQLLDNSVKTQVFSFLTCL